MINKTKINLVAICTTFLIFEQIKAQVGTLLKSDITYVKISLAQALNLGRPAFQLGVEHSIKEKTTASLELGLIMNYGYDNIPSDRKNGTGFQGFADVKHFPFGLSSNSAKIYFGIGGMFRKYNFDASLTAAMGVPENGTYQDAKYFQNFSKIKYNTTTMGINATFGTQINISNSVIFDFSFGFGPRYHIVKHDLKHTLNFVLNNFSSSFVTPSNAGNYTRAGMLLQAGFGFKL